MKKNIYLYNFLLIVASPFLGDAKMKEPDGRLI